MTSAYDVGAEPTIELRHRLRIAREFAGLDQGELADRMEVTRSTVSNAETGVVEPRRATVNAWAMACGVRVSWIRGEHGGDDPGPSFGLRIISNDDAQVIQLTSAVSAGHRTQQVPEDLAS